MSTQARHPIDYSVKGTFADVGAAFAGVLLLVTAIMDVLQGMAAIANDELFAAGTEYLYKFDVTAWGWIHVIFGVISAVVGIGILMRTGWGQVTGIIVAAFGILANFVFLPYYPIWALVLIAFHFFVIWALTVQMKQYA